MSFLRDEGAQVSAELIIIMAAVIAVALVLIWQLQSTARTGAAVMKKESERAFREISEIANSS